jgi:hypothetical protein
MSDVAVFVGPSLSQAEGAAKLPGATFYGPAQLGDLCRASQAGHRTLVLIDGVFEQVPAVWHKEILLVIEQGVQVIGASSMGALRAAELHTMGMHGVGWVFEQYRDGLEDDDEVALVHADSSFAFAPLSLPLINLRYLLGKPALTPSLATTLELIISALKANFYPLRTRERLADLTSALGASAEDRLELLNLIDQPQHNIKRLDALAALRCAGETASGGTSDVVAERTVFLQMLIEYVAGGGACARGRRHAELAAWLSDSGLPLPQASTDDLQADLRAWQRRLGLTTPQRVQQYLDARGLSTSDLLRAVACVGGLRRAQAPGAAQPPGRLDLFESLL